MRLPCFAHKRFFLDGMRYINPRFTYLLTYLLTVVSAAGHQKKLMLAVEKLKRISAALLRHSTSRRRCVTSSPPSGDLQDSQGQNGVSGTLKAVRRQIPPIDNCSSVVVPISVCHSASILPVTSQKQFGFCFDDVITPTNERCVTSFGDASAYRLSDGDERRNTSTSRNYFGAANAYNNGMVNVNGVCFSVYGTLPRNLIRRRAKQGQVQGQTEAQERKLADAFSDEVWAPRRQPAPSPPKRINSIKTDVQRPPENDLESTLTRRRRGSIPRECEVNDRACDSDVRGQTIMAQTEPDSRSWYPVTENGHFRSFSDANADTIKQRMATSTLTDSVVSDIQEDSTDGEDGEKAVVLDDEFDSGTVKRRQNFPGSQNTQSMTTQDDRGMSPDAAVVSDKDAAVLDQEFDGGTLKRRRNSPAVTSSGLTQRLTTEDDQRGKDDAVSLSDDVMVLDQEFDRGTLKRRHNSPAVTSSGLTQCLTTVDDQQVKGDAMSVSDKDAAVLDQEFDGGTVKRRHKPPADDSNRFTDSVKTDVDFWQVLVLTYFLLYLLVYTRTCLASFSYSSPVIWNAIPLSVRDAPSISTFKRRLKSFCLSLLCLLTSAT